MFNIGSTSQQSSQQMMNFGGLPIPPSYPFIMPYTNFFRGRDWGNKSCGPPNGNMNLGQLCGKLGHLLLL